MPDNSSVPASLLCHTHKLPSGVWESKITLIEHNGKVVTFPAATGSQRSRAIATALDQIVQWYALQP
jgi:hypothetical protein